MKSWFALIVILFFYWQECVCQHPIPTNYNEQNGLPSSEVYQIFEDNEGFIWFATDNGVARFDGGEFKLFNKSNGLADAVVFSIIEGPNHDLWFNTFAHVTSVYRNGQMTPYKYNSLVKQLLSNGDFLMAVDSLGQFWSYSQAAGLVKITKEGIVETHKVDTSAFTITRIYKNNFLISQPKPRGPFRIIFEGKTFKLDLPRIAGVGYNFKQWHNHTYFSYKTHLFKLEGETAKLVYVSEKTIINLSVDKEGNLWAGLLAGGAIRFANGTFDHSWRVPFLNDLSITSVLQDHEGALWFSTLEKGVFYLPNPKILSYPLNEKSKTNFAAASGESVYVGSYDGRLTSIDKRTKKRNWTVNLRKSIVAGVSMEKDSLLWVSTSENMVIINRYGKVVKEYDPLIFGTTRFLSKKFFKTSDRIFGINSYGVLESDLKGNLLSQYKLNFWSRNIFIVGDRVYLAGITGLYQTDRSFRTITEIKAFVDDKISDFALLPDNKILVATAGSGFKIIDGQKVISFSKKEGLLFDKIYSIAVTNFLWLATDMGLFKLNLDLLLKKNILAYDFLDSRMGLMNNKVNFVFRNGSETWCIYNDGFSTFDDKDIRFMSDPKPRLEQATVNSIAIDVRRLKNLSYQQNNIGFDFRFQSYGNRHIFLRHRASASDRWNYTENFTVNYTLAPGSYRFEVEYSIDKINWHSITFPSNVNIHPPWWRTLYFQLVSIGVFVSLALIYLRRRIAGINERNSYLKLINAQQHNLIQAELETLERERSRIAKDLHDSVGTNLMAIKMMVNNILKKNYDPRTEAIEAEFQSTIQDIKGIIHELVPAGLGRFGLSETIRHYAAKLEENLDLKIEVNSFGPDLKNTNLSISLFRILQELLANTLKHSQASEVIIHLNSFEDLLNIVYQDNGKGFEINEVKKGSGLTNIQSRIQTANGSLKFETGPFGVIYIIDIPINQKLR